MRRGPTTRLHPYKGRRPRLSKPVDVYRNLNKSGVWYSIRQDGRVIAHAQTVVLINVKFVVGEAGRQRVLKTGRRNVHAFARGTLCYPEGWGDALTHKAGYNPRKDTRFWVDYEPWREGLYRMGLKSARCAQFNRHGLTVDGPVVLP